jgi:hypothetical protein
MATSLQIYRSPLTGHGLVESDHRLGTIVELCISTINGGRNILIIDTASETHNLADVLPIWLESSHASNESGKPGPLASCNE